MRFTLYLLQMPKLEWSNIKVSAWVLSLFNGEKCGLQKTSKGKFQAPNSGV